MMYNYIHQKRNTVDYSIQLSHTIQLVILKDNSAQLLKKRELKINKKSHYLKENAQQKTYLVSSTQPVRTNKINSSKVSIKIVN